MARNVLIEFRRDTAANWTSANPTLDSGEPGFETNTGKFKIGDGATAWNSLAYVVPAALPPNGSAGGVLSGTYPNPGFAADMATQAELDAVAAAAQPLDSDLTAIAGLDSSTSGAIASDGSGWIKKTYAQFKTALGLVKADVGLGSVDNTADSAKSVASAATLTTARNIDGQSFDGSANVTVIAPGTHAATGKATPVDADELPIADSAASFVLKKLTWANLKATLKAYTDTLYPAGSGTSTGTNTGDQTSVSGNAGTATALQTARAIDDQNFDGTAAITVIAPGTHAATGKTTPVDADELPLVDSAASNVLKKLTWANVKATLKTYFDGLYVGVGVVPPGYELNYTAITSTVNVTSTTESSGTTIISPGAITFDGAAVLCHFQAVIVLSTATSATNFVDVSLFESSTQITRLAVAVLADLVTGQQLQVTVSGFYRFTPTAGAHTYTVTAFTNSTTGTPRILAGSGGTAGSAPAFIRFTKV